jgi:glycosyltransferase involved in cell wall biosynthesis
MRVLLISHTCQSRSEGQAKAEAIGHLSDVDLCVLTPARWKHYGRWRAPEFPRQEKSFQFVVGEVKWPWAGPAKCFLHRYPNFAKLLRDFRPDIIDVWEEPWSAVSNQVCKLRDRVLPAAKIISETEQNIDKALPPPFSLYRRRTFRSADFLIGRNHEAIANGRRRKYHGPAAVVPNGVDTAVFRPTCGSELGLKPPADAFTVGYVGRLVEEKGITDLIESLRYTPGCVSLLIVGSGPMAEELRRRVAADNLAGRVKFQPQAPPAELAALIQSMDLLVLPSRTTATWKEQFGRVLIEAYACRVPVVGTSSGAIPEVVGNGGIIVPERDPRALAQAIRQLFEDPAHRDRLAENGYRTVHARYSWECIAAKMREIYQSLMDCKIAKPQHQTDALLSV